MIIVVTPSYCRHTLLADYMAHVYRDPEMSRGDVVHVLGDNHYPVNKEKNSAEIRKIARDYGAVYHDNGRDVGLTENVNACLRAVNAGFGDIVIGSDPDDRPSLGFVGKFVRALSLDPKLAVAASLFSVIDQRIRQPEVGMKQVMIGDMRAWQHPSLEMWNLSAARMDDIIKWGYFDEANAYYGGAEHYIFDKLTAEGKYYAYLEDVRSDAAPVDKSGPMFDPEYKDWKFYHAHRAYQHNFEYYLNDPNRPTDNL